MPLWSVNPNNLVKPNFNIANGSRNVIATDRGWEYFDGKSSQILVAITNLATLLGDNKIYRIYLDENYKMPGTHTNAVIYVEFVKPYALIANPENNAVIQVKIGNTTVNFYFEEELSNPLGGLAVFVAPSFSFTADDYVRVEENGLQYFDDVFAATVNSETINFEIQEIVLYGTPT